MARDFGKELLVHKNISNQLSESEKVELENLLGNDADFNTLNEEITTIWNSSESIVSKVSFDKERARQDFFNKIKTESSAEIIQMKPSPTPKSGVIRYLYYAMAVASMFLIGFFALKGFSNADNITFASVDKAQIIELPDGSKVTMSPNSKLEYGKKGFIENRNVKLEGTAIFEVVKSGKNFKVHTNGYDVEVLGTTFLVEAHQKANSVKVLEGKVRVENKKSSQKAIITDRQGVDLSSGQIKFLENVSFSQEKWLDPEMDYNKTPLSKVISDIESKFGVKFEFKLNQNSETCNFSSGGSLKSLSLAQIIEVLESTLDAKIIKKDSTIYTFKVLNCR